MRFGSLSGDGKGAVEYISSVPSQAARLEVSSNSLFFGRPSDHPISRTITISNVDGPSTTPIVYKVLANNLVDFTVNPNRGLLSRGQSVEVTFTKSRDTSSSRRAQRSRPRKDQFIVKSLVLEPGWKMANKSAGDILKTLGDSDQLHFSEVRVHCAVFVDPDADVTALSPEAAEIVSLRRQLEELRVENAALRRSLELANASVSATGNGHPTAYAGEFEDAIPTYEEAMIAGGSSDAVPYTH